MVAEMTNLVNGVLKSTLECDVILDELESRVLATLAKERLPAKVVVEACDRLLNDLDEEYFISSMMEFGIDRALGESYIREARLLFGKEAMLKRLETELGKAYDKGKTHISISSGREVHEYILPLGVLLHIPAGNADGLPIFSVLEGLLTGNINILKLPSVDNGMTIRLFCELFKLEPILAEYVYVFDYSSKDIVSMQKLFNVADGVIVWGGDEAIHSLRALIKPNTRIIEWGHKVSFAYVTKSMLTAESMRLIAQNIAQTDQLLCSSCQGVYIDSDDMEDIYKASYMLCEALDTVYEKTGKAYDLGIRSQNALILYAKHLEKVYGDDDKVITGKHCTVIAKKNSNLEVSEQFGIVWVKRLNRSRVLETLRLHKNHLQTLGLLCGRDERKELVALFSKIGIVKVCSPERMSTTYENAPHDGEYPLRRYTKIFTLESGLNADTVETFL